MQHCSACMPSRLHQGGQDRSHATQLTDCIDSEAYQAAEALHPGVALLQRTGNSSLVELSGCPSVSRTVYRLDHRTQGGSVTELHRFPMLAEALE